MLARPAINSFGHAAGLDGEESTSQMLPASGSNYDLILEALKTRGGIMFEGKNGAAIR